MSDLFDLKHLLKSWPYDPDNDARIVRCDDEREVLQVRTPLGIEQMELDGRPDSARPYEMESALEYHLQRLNRAKKNGLEDSFKLDAEACAEIFSEGTLYYLRYLRLFQLRRWAETVRDTARNLRAFDLVHEYAEREEDRTYLEKWRPYIVRMNAAAAAALALENNAHDDAIKVLRNGIEVIELLDELDDETFSFERTRSLAALRDMENQILQTRPVSPLERLEQQLQRAIDRQEFERAAQLRDRIRELKTQRTV